LGVLWTKQLFEKIVKAPVAGYAAAGICLLAVPVLMAQQGWDDHDRSQKTLALDLAKNYLKSCPPNAILFTAEDNDSYALWYAQEVEGIRKDVRVVVSTLIGTDWGIDQLRYKVNKSDPFNMVFTPEQVAGDKLNVVYYSKMPGFEPDRYYDLQDILKNVVGSDDPRYTSASEEGDVYHLFPVQKFSVPVDAKTVTANGTVNTGDKVVDALHIDLGNKNYLFKNDLAMLAVIAGNQWKRPICFTNSGTAQDLGLEKYTRLNGLTYQLVPVENTNTSGVNMEVAYNNIMKQFGYGHANNKGVYFDEENRRHLLNIRAVYGEAAGNMADNGKKDEAQKNVDDALKIAMHENDLWGQGYAFRVHADFLRTDRKFSESLELYKRAFAIAQSIDDRISMGMELANMSLLANVLEEYQASGQYAEAALSVFQAIGN
jgi:hypothetical protein